MRLGQRGNTSARPSSEAHGWLQEMVGKEPKILGHLGFDDRMGAFESRFKDMHCIVIREGFSVGAYIQDVEAACECLQSYSQAFDLQAPL